jgi:hypothetical protein
MHECYYMLIVYVECDRNRILVAEKVAACPQVDILIIQYFCD